MADRFNEIPQPGDTTKFLGYTVVRILPTLREDNPDIVSLQNDWKRDAGLFLEHNLGIVGTGENDTVQTLHEIAFRHYRQKTDNLLALAQRTYGSDVAILIEGDLKTEFDRSDNEYESSLKSLMGDVGYQWFDDFRKTYRETTFARLGWLPGSVVE